MADQTPFLQAILQNISSLYLFTPVSLISNERYTAQKSSHYKFTSKRLNDFINSAEIMIAFAS